MQNSYRVQVFQPLRFSSFRERNEPIPAVSYTNDKQPLLDILCQENQTLQLQTTESTHQEQEEGNVLYDHHTFVKFRISRTQFADLYRSYSSIDY